MLNIAIFGAPGAGKGTQAQRLVSKYNLSYISTGDILRKEIAAATPLGMQAKTIIEKGNLVSDELVAKIIERFILENKNANGYLFDGFPRTYEQARILDNLLSKIDTELSCLLNLDVPQDELVKRMMLRAEKENRADDKIDVIENRLKEYKNKTFPVIEYYEKKKKHHSINGVGSVDEIFDRLTTKIDSL